MTRPETPASPNEERAKPIPDSLLNAVEYKNGRLYWRTYGGGKRAGCVNLSGYRMLRFESAGWSEARIIYTMHHGQTCMEIDHINRNKTDNRIENLRAVSRLENAQNLGLRKTNTTGLTGVYYQKRSNNWRATAKNTSKHLGMFATKLDAAAAALSPNA